MQVKFWGTRGSLPRAASHASILAIIENSLSKAKGMGIKDLEGYTAALRKGDLLNPVGFGGNTSCTQISQGNDSVFIDSGSGIAFAGDAMMAQGKKEFHLFQTHFHWDHVMGLPFFIPIYIPGNTIHIYHVHKTGEDDIKIQFNGRNFPVTWDQLGANVIFHNVKLYDRIKVGELEVSPFALDHPGGSFGYRVEHAGSSFAVGVDGEYKRFTQQELGKDLKFYQNLGALVFDSQYEMDELVNKYDWGHCTPSIGVDLALREGIRALILTHHDPRSPDEKAVRMLEDARKYLATQIGAFKDQWAKLGQPEGPAILSAYDGMELTISENRCKIR